MLGAERDASSAPRAAWSALRRSTCRSMLPLVAPAQRVSVGVLLGGGVLGLLLGADPAGGPRALVEHADALHLDQA